MSDELAELVEFTSEVNRVLSGSLGVAPIPDEEISLMVRFVLAADRLDGVDPSHTRGVLFRLLDPASKLAVVSLLEDEARALGADGSHEGGAA